MNRYLVFANLGKHDEAYEVAETLAEAIKIQESLQEDSSVETVDVFLRLRYPEKSHRVIRDE